jgi:prepilin-type N-terminal cleavage/methylation domain-containing protein
VKGRQRGFTLIELLIVVAVIAIIAAIAIPALLRSRLSANESAAIGDVRAVISAQAAYHSANGGFYEGNLGCLTGPQACLPSYPPNGPAFLDSNLAALNAKAGYSRAFTPGPAVPPGAGISPSSATGYQYDARPTIAGTTGIRAFAGDHSGRVCFTVDGSPVPGDPTGGMSRACEVLR